MLLCGSMSFKEHRLNVGEKGISVKETVAAYCGSTTFSSYDFIQNIFKIDVATVEITKIVQNAGPILEMAAI